jgi:hypothetical protein
MDHGVGERVGEAAVIDDRRTLAPPPDAEYGCQA